MKQRDSGAFHTHNHNENEMGIHCFEEIIAIFMLIPLQMILKIEEVMKVKRS